MTTHFSENLNVLENFQTNISPKEKKLFNNGLHVITIQSMSLATGTAAHWVLLIQENVVGLISRFSIWKPFFNEYGYGLRGIKIQFIKGNH